MNNFEAGQYRLRQNVIRRDYWRQGLQGRDAGRFGRDRVIFSYDTVSTLILMRDAGPTRRSCRSEIVNKHARVVFGLAAGAILTATTVSSQQSARPAVSKAQADRWLSELSNWGRWGKDDELGALNLITQQKRQQAMALAKTGTVVSLERTVALTPKPEETKKDGKPHGISYYEIRFKTFPADRSAGESGFQQRRAGVPRPWRHDSSRCALPRQQRRQAV
jgi:hypothetical protein